MATLAAVVLLALIGCVARTCQAAGDDGGSPPPPPTLTPSIPSSPPPPPTPTPVIPTSPPPPPTPTTVIPSSPPPPPPTPTPSPPRASSFTVDRYSKTCRRAEDIDGDVVRSAMYADRSIGARLLRLFFHDCFGRGDGCDVSVLLDPTPANPQPEKLGIPNFPSFRGFEVIDATKAALERECKGVASYADIVSFASRDATFLLSNNKIYFEMPAGRYDGQVSLASETILNLRPPFADMQQLKAMFAAKGLTTDEMVTLSSAHSVSRYHCSSFANHLPPNPSDMNPALSRSLQGQCRPNNGSDNTVVQDIVTLDDLDNQYYRNVMYHNALLKSDATLMTSPETATAVIANSYASWQWKSKLKAAMVRMGSIGVKTSAAPPAWLAALYVSVMYGALFGLLSMGAVMAVAAPVMLVTWTTVLVLLAFAGKPRRSLVAAGRRATADIARLALRMLLREGNAVAALCAVASFAVLLLGRRDDHANRQLM